MFGAHHGDQPLDEMEPAGVQVGTRLVEEEHLGVPYQATGNREAFLLSLGKRARSSFSNRRKLKSRRGLINRVPAIPSSESSCHLKILVDREISIVPPVRWDKSNL